MLSSLPGSCVSAVSIEGASHEYDNIKGIKESVMDIVLNIKGLAVKKHNSSPSKITLDIKKAGIVTAKDIKCTEDVRVLNPNMYIATLDKGAKLKVDIEVTKGVGYSTVEERLTEEEGNKILVDANYSPVKNVKYEVSNTRVGKLTDLDKITLTIDTNESMEAGDALKFAANVLKSYFSLFDMDDMQIEPEFTSDVKTLVDKKHAEEAKKEEPEEKYTPIEILNLSPRTLNSLIGGGVGSVEILLTMTEPNLKNLRGFGKKAMTEIMAALKERNLNLAK